MTTKVSRCLTRRACHAHLLNEAADFARRRHPAAPALLAVARQVRIAAYRTVSGPWTPIPSPPHA